MTNRLQRTVRLCNRSDDGASAVEYALLASAIAAVIVAVVFGIGSMVRDIFTNTSSCISTSGSTSC